MHTDRHQIVRSSASGTLTRIVREAPVTQAADGLELEARLVPWDTPAAVSDDGRTVYREQWERGSLVPGGLVAVYGSHTVTPAGIERGPLIGRATATDDRDDGFHVTLRLFDIPAARDVHTIAREMPDHVFVSLEADVDDAPAGDDGVVTRSAATPGTLTGVAVVLPPHAPAYSDAMVTAVRVAVTPEEPEIPAEEPEPEEPADRAQLVELVRAEVVRASGAVRGVARPLHPLARFDSLQSAVRAGYTDPEIARSIGGVMVVARALADQITTDPNTGVVHIGWINQIYGIVDQGRPAINAIGTADLPDEGMTINWPTFAGDLTTLVGVQATQKTAITSVKVSIGNGTVALKTFAGGSDVSLQLINRSSPSYLEAYFRIMAAAYAAVTDKDAATALTAQVTLARNNFVLYDPAAADATGSVLRTAIFTASTKVQAATGQPATVVLAGLTAFVGLGGKLTPAPVFNATGTANASTLDINVDGLRVVYDPYLAATEILVTNGLAAQWREDGPQTINATDVERLGQSYAVWGLGLLTPTIPTGVVGLRVAAPTVEDAEASFEDGYLSEAPERASKK